MAKVVVVNGCEANAQMIAYPLRLRDHEVLVESYPIDFERVMHFGPQVIVIGLSRTMDAYDRPIGDAIQDIEGFESLIEMEKYPAVNVIPMILIGNALREKDIPTSIHYDLFVNLPQDFKIFLDAVDELAHKAKSRRRISGYLCPKCRGRLTFSSEPIDSLFCPRCGTAVVLIDDENCLYSSEGGHSIPCKTADLKSNGTAR